MDKFETSVDTFNRLATRYESRFMDFPHYQDTYDRILEYLPDSGTCGAACQVLDIGCGPGNIARYLLDRRPDLQLTGTDLAPNMVELARRNNPTARFMIMDSRKISSLTEKFDLVVCGFCIPYLELADVRLLIGVIAEHLNPQGLLYLSYIDGNYQNSKAQTNPDGDQVFTHYFEESDISGILQTQGFTILEVIHKPFPATDDTKVTETFIYATVD